MNLYKIGEYPFNVKKIRNLYRETSAMITKSDAYFPIIQEGKFSNPSQANPLCKKFIDEKLSEARRKFEQNSGDDDNGELNSQGAKPIICHWWIRLIYPSENVSWNDTENLSIRRICSKDSNYRFCSQGQRISTTYNNLGWVKIVDVAKDGKEIFCYPNKHNEIKDKRSMFDFPWRHGWCETCKTGLSKDCVPSPDKNWGWCLPDCDEMNVQPDWHARPHEAVVDSFVYENCSKGNNKSKISINDELNFFKLDNMIIFDTYRTTYIFVLFELHPPKRRDPSMWAE